MEALVLLSGGIDSAACVAFYKQLGHDVSGLFIDYGQPVREREEESAMAIAAHYQVPFNVIRCTGPKTNYAGLLMRSSAPTARAEVIGYLYSATASSAKWHKNLLERMERSRG